jgi:hypothetical protein
MSWNYRVMRSIDPDGAYMFAIYEVFYDDTTGAPNDWSAEPSRPQGETIEELAEDAEQYLRALEEPVIAIEANGDELYEVDPTGSQPPVLIWQRSAEADHADGSGAA